VSVPEQITKVLDRTPSTWTVNGITHYEWAIPETTINRLPQTTIAQLRYLGCEVYNVDTSRYPYYYVAVRFTVNM
jgi:hypothetical protein